MGQLELTIGLKKKMVTSHNKKHWLKPALTAEGLCMSIVRGKALAHAADGICYSKEILCVPCFNGLGWTQKSTISHGTNSEQMPFKSALRDVAIKHP